MSIDRIGGPARVHGIWRRDPSIGLGVTRAWQALILMAVLSSYPTHASQSDGGAATSSASAAARPAGPLRLEGAHRRLAAAAAAFGREASLVDLLRVVLPVAAESEAAGPADDHRASLVIAAFYINDWPITWIAPDARGWPIVPPRRVTLNGRRDQARHFVTSAAMAAAAGSAFSDVVGLYKELQDSRGGSGFSFTDMAANRAGQRFGTLATASPGSARQLAARLRGPFTDADLVPDMAGLPDALTEAEFRRRYDTTASPAFKRVVDDIDRRIRALPIYR